ncbi:unnamed protein product [Allacma fusca]|uniref:DOMON domain-containing protein n=1 Tax=Allacma fusca TaxID=39272 RepID=A0A8J2NKR0_9HEXA|nr:unnamed protein product [Allacma fusca]
MDIFILFSYVAAALYGVVDLQLKTSGTGTDAYPQPQNNPEALDNGSLLFWYPSPSAPSKRRNPRSAGTSVPYNEATVQKENELCRPSRDSMLQGVHLPHCSIVKKQSTSYPEQYLKFKFAKLSYPGYYRLIIDSKSLETIKFLSISAVSASHHFIGSLAIGGTHKTKSLEYYTPTSPDCAHPPDANPDLVQNINLPQPKLSEFFHKKSKIEDGEANPKINDFHISILFSDIDKTILGISDNSFIPERNRFIFVVNVQDFNVNVSKKTVAGDCYFNFRSKVYTLRHDAKPLPPEKENEDLTSGSEYVISGESTFDASGNPKISVLTPPPFTTPKPTTTSTARKSTKPYSRTTPTVTTTFPYKTISPLITDSNGLVPDYTTPAGYVPRVPTKKSKPEKELTSNSIYHGCGKKKGCIGDPPDCVKTKSCSSVVTYGEDDDFVKFELMGRAGKYVAIGLSWDRFMGNDSVMECVREYRTQVNAYVSWNFPNRRNLREEDQKSISRVRGKYDNGNIMCEFWKARVFKSKYYEKKIDLGKETFFVLQARGNTAIEGKYGNIGYHSEGTSVTKITYNLHERFRVNISLAQVQANLDIVITDDVGGGRGTSDFYKIKILSSKISILEYLFIGTGHWDRSHSSTGKYPHANIRYGEAYLCSN